MKTKVGIIGATGYTGLELIRLLLKHPQVEITALTSEKSAGKKFSDLFPAFQKQIDLNLESLQGDSVASKINFAFLCLPHHESMEAAAQFLQKKIPVIDLSADFRLSDASVYESWYGPHSQKKLLEQAVYGLPELYRESIRTADLIANPGCYPTSCILGLAPLLRNQLVDLNSIHCDSKSGVSGAGRKAELGNIFCEVNEGFKAYKIGAHRHTPEIEQELSKLSGEKVVVSFTPHLVPMNRGILSTLYARAKSAISSEQLHQLYTDFYAQEPFVRVRPLGVFPSTQEVKMSNFCDIGVHFDARTQRVIVVSVIDNLIKGASGQALQNFNLRMSFEEAMGLGEIAPSS